MVPQPGGSQRDPKFLPKINENCNGFLEGFWGSQGGSLDSFWEPFWSILGLKFRPNFGLIFWSFFHWLFDDFAFISESKTDPKSYQNIIGPNSKKHVFAWKVVQTIKVAEPQNAPKTTLKSIKNSIKNTIKFWMDFLMVFGLMLVSFWT